MARDDLIHRIGDATGVELLRHSIVHTTSSEVNISTKSLHIKLNPAPHNDISKGLLEVLAWRSQETLL